ncbi:NAD-dependent protein deacetylase [Corynebacterium sp. CNCTC7651]|uniref:Sir2 family NAD-dependent protein deacetylase n=1 Tax=Corynebacterium sp. CNCTC7651 TaxID=2815361 RepID=UPI001F39DDCB|nr:Sir2 family NAD-dependent protein deacetylase [Corynebacterium sp. CNCTC7651]UIZ92194.1 NAD-dependent protein deacetylase [Corynebacterium sp. CNCTC7651]
MDLTTQTQFEDPAIAMAHASAVRSIERVVRETAEPTEGGVAKQNVLRQLAEPKVLVVTGAGMSTESGIPDYRSKHGRLTKGRPMTYQEFAHSPAQVRRYWARAFVGIRFMRAAAPNRAHFALVELERAGLLRGIVTQNVDGLHAEAGSQHVIALHGDMDHVVCLDCGALHERTLIDALLNAANPGYFESVEVEGAMINPDGDVELRDRDVARFTMVACPSCGGERLKPNVVYFGENVPKARRAEANRWLEESTSVIAIGTSLAVMSGYKFVLDAKKQGKPVAVINGGPGRADQKVDTVWRANVGDALGEVLDGLGL